MNINNINYFDIDSITSQAELKKVYRKQSKILHPDAGGTAEQFQQLSNEFDYINKYKLYDKNIRKDFKVNQKNAKNVTQPKNAHSKDFYKNTSFNQKTTSKPSNNTGLSIVNENKNELALKTLDQTTKPKGILNSIKSLPKGAKIATGVVAGAMILSGLTGNKEKREEKSKRKEEKKKNKIKHENNTKNVESWRLINNDLNNAKNISQFSKGHSTYNLG